MHKQLYKTFINRIRSLHQFCSLALCLFYYRGHLFVNRGGPLLQWEDDSDQTKAYEHTYILVPANASVAQTTLGIDAFNCMRMMKTHTHNVLVMLTTSTFAHAQASSACACHARMLLLRML